ncbi:MAG: hypothetical protein AB7R77_05975 [Ilumatobacteraceae bacterium]
MTIERASYPPTDPLAARFGPTVQPSRTGRFVTQRDVAVAGRAAALRVAEREVRSAWEPIWEDHDEERREALALIADIKAQIAVEEAQQIAWRAQMNERIARLGLNVEGF